MGAFSEESAAISIPDLRSAKRILCVQPHYDDNDIGAGGTIAALSGAGAETFYLTVTDDLVGVLDSALSNDDARAQLQRDQAQAGAEIGVTAQHWLDHPDAGDYDYYQLRSQIIAQIRRLRPDFVFTVDPWLPYEAHRDHLKVGQACAEAVLLQRHLRLPSDPEIDARYEPYDVEAVVFYFTREPNTIFDISDTRERKHRAIGAYRAQFTDNDLAGLVRLLEAQEREWATGKSFSHGEGLKLHRPGQLHVNLRSPS